MKLKKVEFVKSVSELKNCPQAYYPEIAFIGRSNVGKSSLINTICNNKKLAKVSDTPGKTKTINHYIINGNWYLVDLPGYGFAKISQTERIKFLKIIKEYIAKRETLKCTMILLDSRIELQSSDVEFIHWVAQQQRPFAIVLTKTDKLSKTKLKSQTQYFEKQFTKIFEELPNLFYTSAIHKTGREELLEFIEYLLSLK